MFRAALLFIAITILLPAFHGQEAQVNDAFSGVAVGTGGSFAAKTVQFDFRVTHYATDEEIAKLAAILKEKGQDGLKNELEKLNAGRINAVGSTGNRIAVARRRQVEGGSVITIVTARYMSFQELSNAGRSRDYPFGFLQVKLDDQGKGTGQFVVAAKISFDKKNGRYDIESFGNQYIKATNVRPMR